MYEIMSTLLNSISSRKLFVGLGILVLVVVLAAVWIDPVYAVVIAGMFFAPVLMQRPVLSITLTVILGLVVSGILQVFIYVSDKSMLWGIAVLGFIITLSALVRLLSRRGVVNKTPAFVWAALIFVMYAVVVGVMNWHFAEEFILAFKRYFQMMGILFALSWFYFDRATVQRWKRLLLLVALIQLPFALYELVILVPYREGFASSIAGLVPVDVVAGTFGIDVYGGGASGEMATFLVMALAFLLAYKKNNLISTKRMLVVAPFILTPLFLGETKIVLIFMPLMFLLLYFRDLVTSLHKALVVIVVGGVLTYAAGAMYLSAMGKGLSDMVEMTVSYNLKDMGYGNNVLNRTTALTFWAEKHGIDEPVSSLLGHGLGSSHSATQGHLALQYPGYGLDLTAVSVLLWDIGIVGLSLFLSILMLAWNAAKKLERESKFAEVKAEASAIKICIAFLAINIFFDRAALEVISWQIVFSFVLGYLAWLHRNHQSNAAGRIMP